MKKMFFPLKYKSNLLNGNKNITLRIFREVGKYELGTIYCASSYSGKKFGFNIKILHKKFLKVKDLNKSPISKSEIEKVKRYLKNKGKFVELIKFEVLK